jgi:phosphatidylglycerol lysyltransferase
MTIAGLVGLVRRYWATTLLVAIVLVAGVATGALWHGVAEGSSLFENVAYGLPALQAGRWWTFLTGMAFAPQPLLYIPVLVLVAWAASVYERRVGHVRTLVVAIGGQILGAVLTALFVMPFDDSGWTWARELGDAYDLGISAGGLALVGALTAVMQPVWRTRVRVGVFAYLIAMVLNSGLLWDVEHLVAFTAAVLAGPFLAGRLPVRPQFSFGRRTQRALVALVIAVTAITSVIEGLFPGTGGPFQSEGSAQHSTGFSVGFIVGALLLLVLADGLRRGRRVAWIISTALLVLTLAVAIVAEPSSERTADITLTVAQLLLLLVTVRAFSSRPQQRAVRRLGRRVLVVGGILVAYTVAGAVVLQDDFADRTLVAGLFAASLVALWLGALFVLVVGLVYSSRQPEAGPEDAVRLRELLRSSPASNIEWMLTWKGISVWFSSDGRSAIGYEVVGSVALCLADPVGPVEGRLSALTEFDAYCFEQGWIPCLFAANQATADMAPQLRWKAIEIAEDSVMSLDNVEFSGKAWQDVRTALNKAGKQEIELVPTQWAECGPVFTDQLRAISGEWVGEKALPEMGFTLGTLREADDPDVRLHLAVAPDKTVEGFTSWMPVAEGGEVVGWTLDLMRRRDTGFRPVMEYLIGASAREFHEQGYRFISLSAAPLAKAPTELQGSSDEQVLQRLLNLLGSVLEPYYGFQSLFRFKEKFNPEHRPLYLVFPDETALAEIGLAVARAYVPDAGFVDWVRMGWEMVVPKHPAAESGDAS